MCSPSSSTFILSGHHNSMKGHASCTGITTVMLALGNQAGRFYMEQNTLAGLFWFCCNPFGHYDLKITFERSSLVINDLWMEFIYTETSPSCTCRKALISFAIVHALTGGLCMHWLAS